MIPKIPIWCIPWKARKRLAELESERDEAIRALNFEHAVKAEAVQQKIAIEMAHEETKAEVVRQKHATDSLTRWIFVTHGIDKLSGQKGLGDILKRQG